MCCNLIAGFDVFDFWAFVLNSLSEGFIQNFIEFKVQGGAEKFKSNSKRTGAQTFALLCAGFPHLMLL